MERLDGELIALPPSSSVLPPDLMQTYRLLEPLQGSLALVGEGEALASSQLLDDIRRQNLPRLSLSAHPCR